MDEETEPHSKQRKGPKMAREENAERASSHEHTECTATYGRTSSEKKKLQNGLSDSYAAGKWEEVHIQWNWCHCSRKMPRVFHL